MVVPFTKFIMQKVVVLSSKIDPLFNGVGITSEPNKLALTYRFREHIPVLAKTNATILFAFAKRVIGLESLAVMGGSRFEFMHFNVESASVKVASLSN